MANNTLFDNPPILQGDSKTQLQQLYRYLGIISTQLNSMAVDIDIRQMKAEQRIQVINQGKEETNEETDFVKTKSLIIKTADIVRTEMDEISTHLQTQVEAISDQFGTYQESLEATISATAAGILQDYHIEERITGIEDDTAEFIRSTSQYIFSGLLDPNTHTYGIAIGYNVTDANGNLDNNNKMATFTADRLSFWQNGAEVAYFSNNRFHIANGEVSDSMKMGNFVFKAFASGAMAFMKV